MSDLVFLDPDECKHFNLCVQRNEGIRWVTCEDCLADFVRADHADHERDRLNAVIADLQDRLADMVTQRDAALAQVDALEERGVLEQLGRAEALILREGFEPDAAEARIEDDRARCGGAA